MSLKLNDLDFLILKLVLKWKKADTADIKEELIHSSYKEISQQYLHQRIDYLMSKKLIITTSNRPLILKINPDYYTIISQFIIILIEFEEIWKK